MSMNWLSTLGAGGCVIFFDAERTAFRAEQGVTRLTGPSDIRVPARSESRRIRGRVP